MTTELDLFGYAQLAVDFGLGGERGVGGRLVTVASEPWQRDLVQPIVELLYRRGAKSVQWMVFDPVMDRALIQHAGPDALTTVHPALAASFNEVANSGGAVLQILGNEHPDLLADLDPKKVGELELARRQARKPYYQAAGGFVMPWTILVRQSPQEALKIFPDEIDPQRAYARYVDALRSILWLDQPDCVVRWERYNNKVHARCQALDSLGIRTLHFRGRNSCETDLVVGLASVAKFVGGSRTTPDGRAFYPNIGGIETFTSPDWRITNGVVEVTRPVMISGRYAKGLKLKFEDGSLVSWEAADEASFKALEGWLGTDPAHRRLGEISLVGLDDSRIFQTGLVFFNGLLDENAACHLALGNGFPGALHGGVGMTPEQLAQVGCNQCAKHMDLMISSPDVDVVATLADGRELSLLESGCWAAEELK